jgi:Fic family protein
MNTKFHKPNHLPISGCSLDFNKFSEELENAQFALGLLEGSQKKLHNPSLLISPLTAKEATVSSKIEGTISTVSDVLLFDAGGEAKHSDTKQVSNYRMAMTYAIKQLKDSRPLTPHLIKTLHGILLKDVRCKGPLGKFRNDAVWIGEKPTDPIEKAIYVPPEHHMIQDYVDNLFDYINDGGGSVLIKTGIAHYQFEAIHPFGDGNGRIGRLLIPLILYQKAKLSQPILYISGYLEKHRDEYREKLHEVDQTGKFENWLAFYFRAISSQLEETQALIDKIYALYDEIKAQSDTTKSPYMIPFIDFIFEKPFFTIPTAQKNIKASARNTIVSLIKSFEENGFVQELSSKQGRAKFYEFKPLVDLL